MQRFTKWTAFAVSAVIAGPGMLLAPSAQARGEPVEYGAPQVPVLEWSPCYEEVTEATGAVIECADAEVPLDYDQLWSPTITVALARIPASDPDNRIGSIMLNPGGPGGSGIDFAVGFGPFAGQVLGPEVPARFDLVGFDPRGIGQSTPPRCFDTLDDALAVTPAQPFPLTRAEERTIRLNDRAFGFACLFKWDARRIMKHMSTANVARDMDLIREALGEEQMNFLGLSYGTFVGATYANLFPDRVRAVVVDGVLDPIAWVNEEAEVPFSTRLRSDEGAQETLEQFFTQCDAAAPGNCALAPNSSERFAAIASALRDEPLILPTPFGDFELTYQLFVGDMLGALYNPFAFADAAARIASLEPALADRTATPAFNASWFSADPPSEQEPYPNFVEAFPAVACADTNNPRSYRVWSEQGAAADEEYGYFGRLWTWASSPCARWRIEDDNRYTGPFDAETANTVLIIGTLYDPATRYEGAQALRSIMPNSVLLSVDTPGHTSLGINGCAGFVTGQYLLDPSVAPIIDGYTCPAEFNAFDAVSGPPAQPEVSGEPDEGAVPAAADNPLIDVRNSINDLIGTAPGR